MPSRAASASRSAESAAARSRSSEACAPAVGLRVFGAGDLLARSCEFRLEPLAFGVAAKLLGFGPFEASLVLARPPRICDQLLDQRANAA